MPVRPDDLVKGQVTTGHQHYFTPRMTVGPGREGKPLLSKQTGGSQIQVEGLTRPIKLIWVKQD